MGPLISAEQREKVAGYVAEAPVATRAPRRGEGFWFPPTVLAPVDNADRCAQEEIFGPVVCVIPFSGEQEAVRLANATPYGLSGSIWTRDGGKALRVARAPRLRGALDQLELLGAHRDAVRRDEAVGLRA